MGKIFKNKSIVTIISIVLCFAILFFAYNYRVRQIKELITIPVAKEELPARTQLTADNITTITVAKDLLPKDNIIRDKDYVLGKEPYYVSYNTFIPKGGMLFTDNVITWSQMPDSAWKDLSEDLSMVSLPIGSSEASLYANTIFPGDKIDIYAKYTDDAGNPVYGPFLTAVTVKAVKDQNGNHIFKKSEDQQQAQALIFALDHNNKDGSGNKFLLFQKALKIMDELVPVPRNETYTRDEEKNIVVGSNTIINYINSIAPDVEVYKTNNDDIKTTD